MEKNYILIGDSITYGAGSTNCSFGWASLFKEYISSKSKVRGKLDLINICGFNGYNTNHLKKVFKNIIKGYYRDNKRNIVLLFIGTNDSQYNDLNVNRVNLKEYKRNINNFIKISNELNMKIVLIGLPGTGKDKLDWKKNEYYGNDMIIKYNDVLKNTSKENKIKLINTFGLLNSNDYYDGLHPNNNGHKRLFKLIIKSLNL